ncbi:MAG: 4-(cytidine 5'-diphospho)-2-C-methyl-D-erythritol kinase, partial [Prevotella sp.]|nr:4-(cytidine 5'-diphospho)-2-C-methyl-D-erythritol kinase [Prevotella sp.]
MTTTNIKACAKINLGLNIVSRRPDGYHNLETVFYPVPIYDDITIEALSDSEQTRLTIVSPSDDEGSPAPPLPVDDNLVMKAYRLVAEQYALPPVSITLVKRIPMQAGMGGGSADCSFTIRLLNEMFNLNMETAEMEAFALRLGADCPFFVRATPAYAEGIGEQLSAIQLDLSQ